MNKKEYLDLLAKELDSMSYGDVKDILDDMEAHFEEGVEAGKTEEQIAEGLGDPVKLAAEFKDGSNFSQVMKKKAAPVIDGNKSADPVGVLLVVLLAIFVAIPLAIVIACILVCLLIILVLAFTAAVYLIVAAVLGTFGTFLPSAILLAVTLLFACIFLFAVTFLGTKYFCKGIGAYIGWNKAIWYKGVGV
ncbi:MAG: DUF1700 domain-containing protein [Clostridiales bacterium]|nr:DUF1700 domain-containing protein [Clostridiales bacterium]